MFLGINSASMHIAAALGTPVIALFGPTGAFSWPPGITTGSEPDPTDLKSGDAETFGRHAVIQRQWDCIPCGRDGCNGTKISNCLMDIKPEEVKEVIEGYITHLTPKETKN